TYDENLARFAPGRVLLYRLIEEQLENRNGKTLEFYTNATRDQADWSTFGCTIHNIQVFRNDIAASAFSLLKVFQRALRGRKKRRPPPDSLIPRANVKACDSVNAIATGNKKDGKLDQFAARDSFEKSIDWFDLLHQQIYPDDPGVRFYVDDDGGFPTTILPLRLTRRGRIKTVESLVNFYTSLYTPLQSRNSDPSAFREMLACATRDHGGAHVMRFYPMDPESPTYRALLNELQAIGWISFKYFCFGNWFLRVTEGWDAYLKKRGVNLRSKIKRVSKKFVATGGTLEIVTTPEGVEAAIAAFQEVYMASWKVPEPYPDFVPSLIRRLAPLGMLRLGIARLQGRPIAAQLWIVGDDKASIYKVAYHEDFASYSPGTVLTAHLMQHVIEQDQVREVDFLIGDDKYKQIWMSDRRERWGIIAFNPRTLIGFALFVREVIARATRSLRARIKARFGETKAHGRPSKGDA
ncbi:MAG: GNAT family N-acetyltransferase, partial [Propionivibrio sp.]